MSIILDALKAKKMDEKKSDSDRGVDAFAFVSHKSRENMPRLLFMGLAAVILIVGAAAGIAWLIGSLEPSSLTAFPAADPVESDAAIEAVTAPDKTAEPLPVALVAQRTPQMLEVDAQKAKDDYAEGRYEDSIRSLQSILEHKGDDYDVHNTLGMNFLHTERYGLAEEHFTRALELNPNCAPCANNLGFLYDQTDRGEAAEKKYIEAIKIEPRFAHPYFNLGVLWEHRWDWNSAVMYYQKFVDHADAESADLVKQVKKRIEELRAP